MQGNKYRVKKYIVLCLGFRPSNNEEYKSLGHSGGLKPVSFVSQRNYVQNELSGIQ